MVDRITPKVPQVHYESRISKSNERVAGDHAKSDDLKKLNPEDKTTISGNDKKSTQENNYVYNAKGLIKELVDNDPKMEKLVFKMKEGPEGREVGFSYQRKADFWKGLEDKAKQVYEVLVKAGILK